MTDSENKQNDAAPGQPAPSGQPAAAGDNKQYGLGASTDEDVAAGMALAQKTEIGRAHV